MKIHCSESDQDPVDRDHSHQRRERQVYRAKRFVKEFKHGGSFPLNLKGPVPWLACLAMSVAQSPHDYKNTNCLQALLENAGLFVMKQSLYAIKPDFQV